jgi:hypothetical protein
MPSHKSLIEAIQFKRLLSVWGFAPSPSMTGRSSFTSPVESVGKRLSIRLKYAV